MQMAPSASATNRRDRSSDMHRVEGRTIIYPDDPDYDARRATFNALIDRRPTEIHVCSNAGDVVAAVSRARELESAISIRGGGHSVAGHCIGDGVVAIDLGGMRHVSVDPSARTAAAGGGATWADYDSATQQHGL